ncbi:basic proline-rich protein-like [Phacochoerus africanus]|uniref:basic proline-rich protein-like n=1 Tax=Phacochoerus africanus TaxID=41426 RepID=UPI001FD9A52A|nr:basic proline-rich protein-like [Phacochoerus africanus]
MTSRGTPDQRPHPVAPTPPGTRASGPPTPASKPWEARRALLTPHYPRRHRRAALGATRPCLLPRPHREPGPHLCPPPPPPPLARSPRQCRRRSEPHTHRYTQPSDVTEPSARPRHCGDTLLPADAAAVSGRPGESEGGGAEGGREGEEQSQQRHRARGPAAAAAAASRLLAPRGRAHRLAYCGSKGLSWPVVWRARPSPQARAPPGARPALLAPRAVWAAGARRFAQPAVWPPPPRPRPTRCSVVTGQTRGRPGRSVAALQGKWGQGGREVHCARPQSAGRRQGRPGRGHRPRSGTGDPPPCGGRSWAAPPRRQPGGGRPAAPPLRALRAGAAPPPPRGLPPEGRPASCPRCAPPHPGGPRLAWAASAQTPSRG